MNKYEQDELRLEEIIYNVREEKAYEAQDEIEDFSRFLAHYFLKPRDVILPLETVVKELIELIKKLGYYKAKVVFEDGEANK